MHIVRIRIKNYRCIKKAEIFPTRHNVFLGPNNTGKTTILEAINLVLNPEITYRSRIIDENDFYERCYQIPLEESQTRENIEAFVPQGETLLTAASGGNKSPGGEDAPNIYIELVLSGLTEDDEDRFRDNLIPCSPGTCEILESSSEGEDPYNNAETAIRVFFEGWYDPEEDDFFYDTYFLRAEGMDRDECPKFTRDHKRYIGFLIYRDFRALTRPVTLEPATLFGHLLQSQQVTPKNFEQVLESVRGALTPMTLDPDLSSVLSAYKAEIERFLSISESDTSVLLFDLTDRTRNQVKANAQLYAGDKLLLPIQKMGAGTRSLAILAMLTLIMRRRGRGILALEEPETFLFPHAQRRVIDECLNLAEQTFVTTHSPYVLERIPVDGVGRVDRHPNGEVAWSRISLANVKEINLYAKRLRQIHCEALVGRGVIIVEGDSDKWWLLGVSRILNGKMWRNHQIEALELQGVSIINADANSDVIKLGNFYWDAGLKVFALFDQLDDPAILKQAMSSPFPSFFLPYKGMEDLLSNQLPIDILRHFLKEAPYCKNAPIKTEEVGSMTEDIIRQKSREWLIENKGSAMMHEWLISFLDFNTIPSTLGDAVSLVSRHISGTLQLGGCSLIE